MEENFKDREKRKRKRIVVKRESTEESNAVYLDRKPIQSPHISSERTFKAPNPNYIKEKHSGPYKENTRDFHGSRSKDSRGQNDNRPNFKKGFKPNFAENPLMSHQFFKKHENPEIPIAESRVIGENELVRLNKYIANAGVCSRREADDLIAKGVIKVNDVIITELGYKIKAKDIVEFKGKRITKANHVYILLNKPKDTITTTSDPENRVTVMDLVQKATDQRIFPIGRLDRNTTGVILLTNDGDFAQKLSHPSSEVKKVYYAILDKPLEREHFEKLVEGVDLEDGPINVDEIAYVDPNDHTMIGVEIHSGKNRIVHRMFESLGYRLKKLDRVVYAGLDKGGLRRSKWRFIKFNEVQMILNTIKYIDEKKV